MSTILVNGQPQDTVPATDRSLLYGDGLFETVAFRHGQAPLWDLHWQRFAKGCDVLGLTCPDPNFVVAQARQASSGQDMAVVRIQLSRGSGGRAYWPDPDAQPRLIVQSRPWPADLEQVRSEGLSLCTASLRLATDSPLAGLKHCNRLEQVLAARECVGKHCDEALLFNAQGCLVEAIASNLVLDIDGNLVTPETNAGVDGVGLAWLMARPEIRIETRPVDADLLASARSIVVINSVAGPRQARSLDGRPLTFSSRCRALRQLWIDLFW